MIDMGEAMDELREQVVDRPRATASEEQPADEHNAVQIETLMLLRAIVPLDKKRMIEAELDRQGMEAWHAKVR
jgi:hypothetical protein